MRTSLLILAFSFFLLGCNNEPEVHCSDSLVIDGVSEGFCSTDDYIFDTPLQTHDSLYIQFISYDSPSVNSSENYLGYNVSFALEPPVSYEYHDILDFVQDILILMKPNSVHQYDIYDKGGFALELWDRDGEYFTTQYGEQENNAVVLIDWVNVRLDSSYPNSNAVIIKISSTELVTLWNIDKTKKREVDFKDGRVAIIKLDNN